MRWATVSPNLLENEGAWDPVVLCSPIAAMLASRAASSLDTWDAAVIDGARTTTQPMIRAAQIESSELRLNPECLLPTAEPNRFTLRAGDVLLSKAPPIKAAWICPSIHHHRFDANCYAIRNLSTSQGIWLTFCLNQFEFSFTLARRSVASAAPRINRHELRRFPIPQVPVGFELLAEGIAECIDQRALNSMELLRLQAEVAQHVRQLVPESASAPEQLPAAPSSWCQRFTAMLLEDSLVPSHVKAGEHQHALRSSGDWRPIRSLVKLSSGHGQRLSKDVPDYRCLRLSDVGSDLRVPSVVSRGQAGNRNVYAEPLVVGEVLHSLLATSPRTVFVAERPDAVIYPTDHWVRLQFNETPGAWALTMQTEPVARQLRSLTTGLTQQFATASAVEQLVLPPVPLALRASWDGRLRRWQWRRNELDTTWRELVDRVYVILTQTEDQFGRWVSPVYEEISLDA